MKEPRLRFLKGKTWCIDSDPCIPLYFLSNSEVVMFDSGQKEDLEDILDILKRAEVRVRAIIGSHTHIDHSGNHRYFQEKFGTEIIMRDLEAGFSVSPEALTYVYGYRSPEEVMEYIPNMIVRADRTFSAEDTFVEVDGTRFEIVHTPGHTAGHTSFVTPDDVFYVADAVMGEEVMQKAKMPTVIFWDLDHRTKYGLKAMLHSMYIVAHGGVYDDISDLCDINLADHMMRAIELHAVMMEKESWSEDELVSELWTLKAVRSRRVITRAIFRRNALCMLEYLRHIGRAESTFEDGIYRYRAV